MNRRTLLLGLLALPLTACGASFSDLPLAKEGLADRYTLGPGDTIKVAVYGFDTMTGSYVVSDAGTISLPLVNTVEVGGKSAPELEIAIASLLRSRDLAPNANVSVQVDKYRPFYILGEVQRPGQYDYVPGMTVLMAVSMAGGYTFRANKRDAAVSRTTATGQGKTRLVAESSVLPGDTIIIPEAWF